MSLTARGEVAETVRGQTWLHLVEESAKLRDEAMRTKVCAFPGCGKKITGRRKVYCSDDCQHDFSLKFYGHSWSVIRAGIVERDNHTCRVCGEQCPKGKRPNADDWCACEVDHIIEVARGGTDKPENLRVLCSTCHRTKTNSMIRKLRRKQPEPMATILDPSVLIIERTTLEQFIEPNPTKSHVAEGRRA